MSDLTAAPRRPRVLLLAGEVREIWTSALAQEFEVATTGWLDGVTAARLERPDVVLVSADLPADAPRLVLTAFRSTPKLAAVPIVVASADAAPPATLWGDPAFRADRHLPATVDAGTLVREVREAVRVGRVKHRRTRAQQVALGLAVVALVAIGASLVARILGDRGVRRAGEADAVLRAIALAAFLAAAALAVGARGRLSRAELRTVLGWAGLVLLQVRVFFGDGYRNADLVGGSLAMLAWAGWAWLAKDVKPRTPQARRGWRLLAAFLAALAVGVAWLAYASGARGR